ncbi:MAG TPA: acetolactate synthase large subunit [Methanomassiliicoccales archaeon]|jgi:acetolactate synthase-1/2/3 large subunit
MKASKVLVSSLENEGVQCVFGIPGEENMDTMDALADSSIQFILTKHENSAAYMAGVQARLTNQPGVCLSTLGPGATNMVNGVADAFLSNLPLIALCGQAGQNRMDPPQKQVVDLISLYRPVTKDSFGVRAPSTVPMLVRKAFDTARRERPGPVMLELPEDIMKQDCSEAPIPVCPIIRARHESSALTRIAEVLNRAERPLILAGHGVVRADAGKELKAFARSWNIPVAHTWMGSGVMPFDDPLSLNTVGMRNFDTAISAFEDADVIVLAGYDPPEFQPQFWNVGRPKTIVYVGESPVGYAHNLNVNIQVLGGLKYMLKSLYRIGVPKRSWVSDIRDRLWEELSSVHPDGAGMNPKNAVKAVREVMGLGDIVVPDVGAHLIWFARNYPVRRENTLLLPNGLITMGVGVPGALAAKMCRPERDVVAVVGDAGFMMTSAELETAKRLGVNFVTIIFNDSGLGLIKVKMKRSFGRDYGCDFTNPDFVKYAESFGAKGYLVERADELKETLKRCLKNKELAVIDARVDYSGNDELFRPSSKEGKGRQEA